MSFIKYEVVARTGFFDLQVWPERIPVGGTVIVDERTYSRMSKSDPDSIELVQKIVPNPKGKGRTNDK